MRISNLASHQEKINKSQFIEVKQLNKKII